MAWSSGLSGCLALLELSSACVASFFDGRPLEI